MTTEADKSAEPEEEILGNLLLTAVALKLSFFSPCPLDILAVTANAKFLCLFAVKLSTLSSCTEASW